MISHDDCGEKTPEGKTTDHDLGEIRLFQRTSWGKHL